MMATDKPSWMRCNRCYTLFIVPLFTAMLVFGVYAIATVIFMTVHAWSLR